MNVYEAAQCLDSSSASVLDCIREAGSGGLLEARTGSGTNRIVVQPELLRFAVVTECFFNPKAGLPLAPILERLPEPHSAVVPLIAAAHGGNPVDRGLLLKLLKAGPTERAVVGYASLGKSETNTAINEFPEFRCEIADGSLNVAPRLSLGILLEASTGDQRPQYMPTSHPLRIIESYAHSLSTTLSNRRNVFSAVEAWISQDGDADAALQALAIALSPKIRGLWSDPGAGNKVTISQGIISANDMAELGLMWEQGLQLASTLKFSRFDSMLAAWRDWVWPSSVVFDTALVSDEVRRLLRKIAREVAATMGELFGDRPGIIASLKQTSLQAKVGLRFDVPADFEILFPSRDQPRGEFSAKKHH